MQSKIHSKVTTQADIQRELSKSKKIGRIVEATSKDQLIKQSNSFYAYLGQMM